MENINEKYRIFDELINNEEVFKDGTVSFVSLCLGIGANPEELDTLIRIETGFGGQEIMTSLRDEWKSKMKAEYGLKDEI